MDDLWEIFYLALGLALAGIIASIILGLLGFKSDEDLATSVRNLFRR